MKFVNRTLSITVVGGALCMLPVLALAADSLIGEWALTSEQCVDTRISYTADGKNEAFLNEDGHWKLLSSGTYRRQGESLTVEANGQSDQLHIVFVDDHKLTLSNADASRMKDAGVEAVDFVRCPAR